MLHHQKGFSLIEVLLSLFLMSFMALALIEQQCQTKLFLNQFLVRASASRLFDEVDESLISGAPIPEAYPPYRLTIMHTEEHDSIRVSWLNNLGSITRNSVKAKGRLK